MHSTDSRPSGVRQRDNSVAVNSELAAPRQVHLRVAPASQSLAGSSHPRKLQQADLLAMRTMRIEGATYVEIAAAFEVHHTTVMYHLDALGRPERWPWTMQPHHIRLATLMHGNGSSYGEIARALHFTRGTVRTTLTSSTAMRDFDRWVATHPVGPPPTAA